MQAQKSLHELALGLGFASPASIDEAHARQLIYGGDFALSALELGALNESQLFDCLKRFSPLPVQKRISVVDLELTHALSERLPCVARREGLDLVITTTVVPPDELLGELTRSYGRPIRVELTFAHRLEDALSQLNGTKMSPRVQKLLASLGSHPVSPAVEEPSIPVAIDDVVTTLPNVESEEVHPWSEPFPSLRAQLEEQPALVDDGITAPPPTDYGTAVEATAAVQEITAVQETAAVQEIAAAVAPKTSTGPERRRNRKSILDEVIRALGHAHQRDDAVELLLDGASEYFDFCAIFSVSATEARCVSARGPGAAELELPNIRIPLDLPSTYKKSIMSGVHQLSRLRVSGIEGGVTLDLKRPSGRRVLLLPILIRGRTVLLLQGDRGEQDVDLAEVGDLLNVGPAVSQALERVVIERKRASLMPTPLVVGKTLQDQLTHARSPQGSLGAHSRAETEEAPVPSAPIPSAAVAMAETEEAPVPSAAAARAETQEAPVPSAAREAHQQLAIAETQEAPLPPAAAEAQAPLAIAEKREIPVRSLKPAVQSQISSIPPPTAPPGTVSPQTQSGIAPHHDEPPARKRVPTSRGLSSAPPLPEIPTVDDEKVHVAVPTETRPLSDAPSFAPADHVKTLTGYPSTEQGRTSHSGAEVPPPAEVIAMIALPQRASPQNTSLTPRRIVSVESASPLPSANPSVPEVTDAPEAPIFAPPIKTEPEIRPTGTLVSRRPLMNEPPEDGWDSPIPPKVEQPVRSGGPKSYGKLVEQLLEGDERALELLREGGESAVATLIARFPGPVRESNDPKAKASQLGPILRALAEHGTRAVPFVTVRTADEDPTVRRYATLLLGELPCRESARAVADRLLDTAMEVRRAALSSARALQTDLLARRTLRADLEELTVDKKHGPEERCAAIEAIADIREQEAIPTLLQLLSDVDRSVVRAAGWALTVLTRQDFGQDPKKWREFWQEHRDTPRVDWLILALGQDNSDLRRAAADELAALTGQSYFVGEGMKESDLRMLQAEIRAWLQSNGKSTKKS